MIHFVLGGARSGKSRFAEQQVKALQQKSTNPVVYIATATALDDEMTHRIRKHQSDRPEHWQLIECPLLLADTVIDLSCHNIYLIDCLTLWLNNQLFSVHEQTYEQQTDFLNAQIDKLVENLQSRITRGNIEIVIVSNEIGLGVVPMGKATRLYVDYCGWLNQKIAAIADQVTLVTAGIPLTIKPQ